MDFLKGIFGASWQTSMLGFFTILAALSVYGKDLLDGDPATTADLKTTIPELMAGAALMRARDNKVSSEQAKAS